MTGNLVFLGLAAAGANGFAVGLSVLALAGFAVGVLVGAHVCDAARAHRLGARDAMVVLLAASMGAQLAAIRFLKIPDLLTVVLTMTLTGVLVERRPGWRDAAMLRRGLSLTAFAVGALAGALLLLNVGIAAALSLGLAIIILALIAAHRVSRTASRWSAPA